MDSVVALIRSLEGVRAALPGSLGVFRLRLGAFCFARRFLSAALAALQQARASQ
jgi:hypothetical protein